MPTFRRIVFAFNFSIKYVTLRAPEDEGSTNRRKAGKCSSQNCVSSQKLGSSRIALHNFLITHTNFEKFYSVINYLTQFTASDWSAALISSVDTDVIVFTAAFLGPSA